jgi:molybdate transport repressor ModE-like protein
VGVTDQRLWLQLELRHLAALRAVVREGSFSAAARSLGYTHSAIGQQIATLERIVGARVVERPGGRRPAEPTAAGRALAEHADSILARLDAARADVQSLVDGEHPSLRVGTYQSVAARLLPDILRRWHDSWPDVDVQLHQAAGDVELLEGVSAGALDLGFGALSASEHPVARVELLRDPYVVVVPAGSPLAAERGPVTLDALRELPLILIKSCSARVTIEEHIRAAGAEPRIVFCSDDNGTIQGLVGAGLGIAVVPRLTMDERDPRTVLRELGTAVPPRVLGLVRHRYRQPSPVMDAFVATARAALR